MRLRQLVLVCALFAPTLAGAQQATGRIVGRVSSAAGQPLPAANVVVQGTNPVRGTQTDANGRFVIAGVPVGTYDLQARVLGFRALTQPVRVSASDSTVANFQLTAQATQLSAVVTVGYGTQSRRNITGAVSSLNTDDIRQVVASNPLDAIKGRIPGVDITSGSFEPGANNNIRIRGTRSISASNNPLYVIDGVPITGDLRDIDPTSIDRIEVLKDASAAAVYGSRGANGVLLVTTKRGTSSGKTEVTVNSTYGVSNVRREVPMMNSQEFANFRRESYRYGGSPAQQTACANYMTNPAPCDAVALDPTMRANLAAGVDTDWQELMLRQGNLLNTQVGFAGGNQNTRFRAGLGYLGQQGISIVQDYVARTVSMNVSSDYKRLNLQLGVQGVRNYRNAGRGAVMWDEALFNPAVGRPYDDNGNPVFLPTEDGLLVNPVMAAQSYIRQIDRTNVLGTLTGSYEIVNGLRAHVDFGPQYTRQDDGEFIGIYTRAKRGQGQPDALIRRETNTNFTLSNYLDLDRTFGEKHHVQATALYEVASFRTVLDTASSKALPFDNQLWYNLGTGSAPTLFGRYTTTALQSYMGRVNYTLLDRYILSLIGRYDGSSVLAEGHKYAFFPAASLGWQIGDEAFMKRLPVISDLKLRLSYGRVGNSAIGAYQTLGLLSRVTYANNNNPVIGFQPGDIPNPDLKWETTDKFNLGLDFGVLDQRISGTIDAYRENTHDLLLPRALPYTSGYASVLQNVGATKNVGIELSLSTQNLNHWHGLDWTSDLVVSTNKNQIVALQSGLTADVGSGRWVGQPINVYFDYQYVGLWQTPDSALARTSCSCKPGDIRVADVNGDGKINADDRTFIGRHFNFPRWQGSLNNRIAFRNIDLSALATARIGYNVNDGFTAAYNSLAGRFNNIKANYWTPENQSGTDPRPSLNGLGTYAGSRNYKEASFVRIRDITLGYTLPTRLASRLTAERARVYVRAQDPFIFTDYEGWDPEAGFGAGNGANNASQIDQGGPAFRSVLFGVDIGF
jgi:TonB-linked SusC/RagA family outer membrane protein